MNRKNFERDSVALANNLLRMAKVMAEVNFNIVVTAGPNDPLDPANNENFKKVADLFTALDSWQGSLDKTFKDFAVKYEDLIQKSYGGSFKEKAASFVLEFGKSMEAFKDAIKRNTPYGKAAPVQRHKSGGIEY